MGRKTGQVLRADDRRLTKRWTREEMLDAGRRWLALYGTLRYEDWHAGAPTFNAERFQPPGRGAKGRYPSPPPVLREFGSWPAFLDAVGAPSNSLRIDPGPRTCEVCGGEFQRGDSDLDEFVTRLTCSRACGTIRAHRFAHARHHRIVGYVRQGMGRKAIADREGTTPEAISDLVCRLRKKHNLPRLPYGG